MKKCTSFCQVLKKKHIKENWFLFLAHGIHTQRRNVHRLRRTCKKIREFSCLALAGHFGIARLSVRLPVPWRSCLGYRHAVCLQLSHRWPPETCGLRTRPRTDVDPPRFLPPSNCHRPRGILSRLP